MIYAAVCILAYLAIDKHGLVGGTHGSPNSKAGSPTNKRVSFAQLDSSFDGPSVDHSVGISATDSQFGILPPMVPSMTDWQFVLADTPHPLERLRPSPQISSVSSRQSPSSPSSPVPSSLTEWQTRLSSADTRGKKDIVRSSLLSSPVPSGLSSANQEPSTILSAEFVNSIPNIVSGRARSEGWKVYVPFLQSEFYLWLTAQPLSDQRSKIVGDVFPKSRIMAMQDWARSRFVGMYRTTGSSVIELMHLGIAAISECLPNTKCHAPSLLSVKEFIDFLVFLTPPGEGWRQAARCRPIKYEQTDPMIVAVDSNIFAAAQVANHELGLDPIDWTMVVDVSRVSGLMTMLYGRTSPSAARDSRPSDRIVFASVAVLLQIQKLGHTWPRDFHVRTKYISHAMMFLAIVGFLEEENEWVHVVTLLGILKGLPIGQVVLAEWNKGNILMHERKTEIRGNAVFNELYSSIDALRQNWLLKQGPTDTLP